ncbi:MAG: FtsX-like permease family protein [Bacteroidota bacterium]
MKFPFFVAQRYFYRGGQKNLIHRIGLISFLSVALSTMALLLVLSVFNGLEEFIKTLFRSFDPDIKITLKKGKAFALDPNLRRQLTAIEGVAKVVEVAEDNALLRYQDRQVIIKLKGVSASFLHQSRLEPFIQQGDFKLTQGNEAWAMLGRGVQYALSVPISKSSHTMQVFYPRHLTSNAGLPQPLYACKNIRPGAVFAVEKQFDESYVIVPIDFATMLMGMENKRTALEIQVTKGFSIRQVQRILKRCVPDRFQVLNSQEQQATLMQAIHVERLFVFLTFAFILFVASLNIFFIISMLVLDKRQDMAVLHTLGATPQAIQRIFLIEGLLIALSGTAVGMAAAWGLGWLQQTFGLVSLGAQTSLVKAYPIKMQVSDFVFTAIGVVCMTLMAAYRPARVAAKTSILVAREVEG